MHCLRNACIPSGVLQNKLLRPSFRDDTATIPLPPLLASFVLYDVIIILNVEPGTRSSKDDWGFVCFKYPDNSHDSEGSTVMLSTSPSPQDKHRRYSSLRAVDDSAHERSIST